MPYEKEISYPPPGFTRGETSTEFYENEILHHTLNGGIWQKPDLAPNTHWGFLIAWNDKEYEYILKDPFWISRITD